MKKAKPYWNMTAQELAKATQSFDDPAVTTPARTPSAADRAKLAKWRQKRTAAKARLTLSLDKSLIEQTDQYATHHGITFSDVVSDALRRLMNRKSA